MGLTMEGKKSGQKLQERDTMLNLFLSGPIRMVKMNMEGVGGAERREKKTENKSRRSREKKSGSGARYTIRRLAGPTKTKETSQIKSAGDKRGGVEKGRGGKSGFFFLEESTTDVGTSARSER